MAESKRFEPSSVRVWLGALTVVGALIAMPGSATAASTAGLFDEVSGPVPDAHNGHPSVVPAEDFRAFELRTGAIRSALDAAPAEFSGSAPLPISLPAPNGGLARFAVVESPVMEPELAAKHPEIKTYSGEGITDPTATIRISVTALGFQASVRGEDGSWYVDPYYLRNKSLYASYSATDLDDLHGRFVDHHGHAETAVGPTGKIFGGADKIEDEFGSTSGGIEANALNATGDQLHVYRLGLASDPSYATYFGAANVTSAKVALINRVTQIYEDDLAIRFVLIGNNNLLNLDTNAQITGANGPCGSAPCYAAAPACNTATLDRNRIVFGQIIGASNYDVGHLVLGLNGGGKAGGQAGGSQKARGCTGVTQPVGDYFAVDYVGHEMGHQYSGGHTFAGSANNCSAGNYSAASAVEPGSGSTIMSYAGICGADDLQAHSDPYFSQRNFDELTNFVASTHPNINEVQTISLTNFDSNDSFRLTFGAGTTGAITRGTNYNAAGITAALASILPAGASVAIADWGGGGTPSDNGFEVTFGGTLAGTNVQQLGLSTFTGGMGGFVGETDKGGPIDNSGSQVISTGNSAPNVSAPGPYTIPHRTPFTLNGSATDPDGDTLTYLWEQNDTATAQGSLQTASKATGPLFRVFGTALDNSKYDGTKYNTGGENHPTTDSSRTFPDMAQILANNTNADSGDCPASGNKVDCYSEFLPPAGYAGPMHFRLTARDNNPGGGGVNNAETTVNLAPGTGPFKVTSPNTAGVTWVYGKNETVTWDVAGTNAAPINTSNVDILLSTDGGATFSRTLASNTANDGSEQISVPDVNTTQARVMVRAVGNIYFDVSNADFRIDNTADMELVSKTDSQDPAYAGEPLTYTITARNNGPATAENARVVDTLPSGTSYQSSSIPCTDSSGTVTCGLGNLADDESKTFTITVFIARDLVYNNGSPKTITNTATADSDRDDPNSGNDQKSESTLVKAKADLAIQAFNAVSPPVELIIGQPMNVTLHKQITNHGPSAPMDVLVSRTALATSNATVSPTSDSHVETALGYQESRAVDETFQVACTAPGRATFTFTNTISPNRPDDIDPDTTNNARTTSFEVECIVPIAINIHPGSFTNPIDLTNKNGNIAVAALTTRAGEYGLPLAFDATTIRADTVRFGPKPLVTAGGGARPDKLKGKVEDAIERSDERTRDGDLDMVFGFRTQQTGLTGTETEACVRGRFGPNYVFQGCDLVSFVPH
jgi:uncharacterized repeat protein (TIGR01451 family)